MGYAFTFHIAALLGGIPVGAYVHYPTISTDMLSRVRSRTASYANSDAISSSSALSRGKLLSVRPPSACTRCLLCHRYYRLFMFQYALALRRARFLMVNSSWTKNHVDSILQHKDPLLDFLHSFSPFALLDLLFGANPPKSSKIVYPPCDTREMVKFPLGQRSRIILSVAQFR